MNHSQSQSVREQQKTLQNKHWLQTNANYIIEPMMLEIVKTNPKDHIDFMIKYMEDKFGERATIGNKHNLEALRNEAARLQVLVDQQNDKTAGDSKEDKEEEVRGSENETDSDNEDDYVDILPEIIQKQQKKGPRNSVSAEAFGTFNKKEEFKARVVPKDEKVRAAIMDKIEKSFMFSGLDDAEKQVVVDAMEDKKVFKNEVVIKEGDIGDCLYVVASGSLQCTKVFKGNAEPVFLKKYEAPDAFGELALLYNAPRAATITSYEECTLYALDRQTFNHIVKDAAIRRRDKYETFLKQIPLLNTMDDYERAQVAEAFVEKKYKAGDFIIEQGTEGKDLLFLVSGEAAASKILKEGEKETEVLQYKTGDYFGELALLRNEPRAANVVAKSDCLCVSIGRHSFKRAIGPLEEILKRNMDLYVQYQKN